MFDRLGPWRIDFSNGTCRACLWCLIWMRQVAEASHEDFDNESEAAHQVTAAITNIKILKLPTEIIRTR